MDILEESRIMLELAISSLQIAGHDTEQFERTVVKIKHEQVEKLNIDDVSQQRELLFGFMKKEYGDEFDSLFYIIEGSIDDYLAEL